MIVLVLAAAVSFTGCEREDEPIAGEPSIESESMSAQALPEADEPPIEDQLVTLGSETAERLGLGRRWEGDLAEMVERRLIRVLVTYSKTNYFLDGARQRGLTYEAFDAFEDWLNEELGTGTLKVYVAMIPVHRDRLLPGVAEGLGDIAAAGITITDERRALVDFSEPLMSGVREVVVTGRGIERPVSLDDLSGRAVYVRESSSYFQSLESLNERFKQAGRDPVLLVLADEYLEDEDILEMVQAELVPMTIVDEHKAKLWEQIYDQITVHYDLAVREDGLISWAFRKSSPELAAVLNRFVREHRKGTLLGNIVFKRYLASAQRVTNAWASEERKRFEELLPYFETYARRYGFDPLMMVAQGYQESGLDQSVVSRSGAVGIMQLLPSTAEDESVGIPDVRAFENNIHAGIKYMAWIRDTYFDDDSVDSRNKALFALASYNAGPNRIRRLRREASERELDPNLWFRNVEILAAEEIGRETVTYVSNIYKYYAAYRFIAERETLKQ
jgi:membrane-bound lytic murein transglycosylase MltF